MTMSVVCMAMAVRLRQWSVWLCLYDFQWSVWLCLYDSVSVWLCLYDCQWSVWLFCMTLTVVCMAMSV